VNASADRSPRRRIWRFLGASVGVAGLLAGLVWWQCDSLIVWTAERITGAQVELEGLQLGNPLRADRVVIRDSDESTSADFFIGEGLSLHLGDGVRRWLSALDFERVQLVVEEVPDRNHEFIQALLRAPSSGVDPLPFLPEKISTHSLSIGIRVSAGELLLEGLRFDAAVRTPSDIEVKLDSSGVSGNWKAVGSDAIAVTGSMAVTGQMRDGNVDAELAVDLPHLAQLHATAKAQLQPRLSVTLDVAPGEVKSPVWPALIGDAIGYPIHFDSAQIAGGALSMSDGQVESLRLDIDTPAVTLGPSDAPHFQGPLKLSAQGSNSTGIAGEVSLKSGDTGPVVLELATADGRLGITLPEVQWFKTDWERLLPGAYRGYLKSWSGLRSASLSGELLFGDEGTSLQAELRPKCENVSGVELLLDARFPRDAASVVNLAGTAKDAGGWKVVYGETPGSAVVSAESVSLAAWIGDVLGYPLALDRSIQLSGSGQVAMTDTGATLNAETTLTQGEVALGEVRVDSGSWSTKDSKLQAPLRLSLNLAAVAPLLGVQDLAGELEGSCKMALAGGEVRVQSINATVKDLALGGTALSGETPLSISGDLRRAASGALRGDTTIIWGDDFKATLREGTWGPDSNTWSAGVLEVGANATALQGFGVLDSGDLALNLTASGWSRTLDVYSGTGTATLQGDLVTKGGLLAAKGLDASLSGDMSQEVALAGPLRAGELAALGVILRDASATLHLTWPVLRVESLAATVFGGAVRGGGEVDLSREGFPVVVDVTLENTDLARFTEEFKPPNNVKLTGLVNGTIRAAVAGESITELDVDLVSGEGFTLDKATVAQMLMSQEIGELSGSGLADKIVKSVVGEDDARPFTGAEVRLGLDGGRISGEALLKSKALNLTVDIHADQQALFEAIRMRQEGQIANFTTSLN